MKITIRNHFKYRTTEVQTKADITPIKNHLATDCDGSTAFDVAGGTPLGVAMRAENWNIKALNTHNIHIIKPTNLKQSLKV